MQSPHDKLFQFAFRFPRHAAPWIRWLCPPAIQAGVDWGDLQPAGERIPGGGLRAHFADAIFRAPFLQSEGALWFVVEHKSYPDPGVRWQLLQYVVHLCRGLDRRKNPQARDHTAPNIVALVLHHGATRFVDAEVAPRSPLARAIEELRPCQRLLVDDLSEHAEAPLRARQLTPLATLVLLCLKRLPHLKAHQVCIAIEQWADLLVAVDRGTTAPIGSDAIDAIGYYALAVTEVPATQLSHLFSRILDRPETTIMSTLEHTYQKGKADGKAEGKAEGTAATILRMLELRFGQVSEAVRQTVMTGSTEQLTKWTDRLLTAAQPEDVIRG